MLIADEPTTALDVTIQAQILEVIQQVQELTGTAIVFITHDLGVIARLADRVQVMYAGRSRELGEHRRPLRQPGASRTQWGCSSSLPTRSRASGCADRRVAADMLPRRRDARSTRGASTRRRSAPTRCRTLRLVGARDQDAACHFAEQLIGQLGPRAVSTIAVEASVPDAPSTPPILEVEHLVKNFPVTSRKGLKSIKGVVQAVSDVSFAICSGETLGLVGESGSGKSTVGRCILRLIEPTAGSVYFQGPRRHRVWAVATCARCGASCRSCSRTRTPRSTPG